MNVETIYISFIGLCNFFGLMLAIAIIWNPDKRKDSEKQ